MKLVIFDCDGTIVDSQATICSAMNLAFAGRGLASPSRMDVLSVIGLSLPEAFAVLAPGETAATRTDLAERYKAAFPLAGGMPKPHDPLFPGAKTAIEALARRGDVVLGIATGKSRRGVARLLDQEAWHPHFRTIQTADDHPSKPHPSMIEQAMRETGIGREATVIVGDTTFDIEMGRNAGVATIGVTWGYHGLNALNAAGAHGIAGAFDVLPAEIDRVLAITGRRA